jgi:hypothetical protein
MYMKKFVIAAMAAACIFTGCDGTNVKDFLLNDVTGENSGVVQLDNVTFNQNDFALYTGADENGNGDLIVGLGMTEDSVDYSSEPLSSYASGLEISYKEDTGSFNKTVDADGTIHGVNRVNYIGTIGDRKTVMTAKGIKTTGLVLSDGENCSSADEVIALYDIDTEKEEYKVNVDEHSDDYCIQLYFKAHFDEEEKQNEIKEQEAKQQEEKEDYDEEDAVVNTPTVYDRVITEKGGNLDDMGIENADYMLRFVISNEKVVSIQLYAY